MGKCFICGDEIKIWFCVKWCDYCLDKLQESGLSLDEFVKREKNREWDDQ